MPDASANSTSCIRSRNSPQPTLLRVRAANTGSAMPAPRHNLRKGHPGTTRCITSQTMQKPQQHDHMWACLGCQKALCHTASCTVQTVTELQTTNLQVTPASGLQRAQPLSAKLPQQRPHLSRFMKPSCRMTTAGAPIDAAPASGKLHTRGSPTSSNVLVAFLKMAPMPAPVTPNCPGGCGGTAAT